MAKAAQSTAATAVGEAPGPSDLAAPGAALIRVGLLAAAALERAAYRQLLTRDLGGRVLAEADFTPTAVWTAIRTPLQVVVVIADRPGSEVVDALDMISRLSPKTRTLVISGASESAHLEQWSRVPLHGLVSKDGSVHDLKAALHAVAGGAEFFAARVRSALVRGHARRDGNANLTRREEELLVQLARGATLREAAATLGVRYKTADSYRSNLLRKLDVHDRVELARYAIRHGLVEA